LYFNYIYVQKYSEPMKSSPDDFSYFAQCQQLAKKLYLPSNLCQYMGAYLSFGTQLF